MKLRSSPRTALHRWAGVVTCNLSEDDILTPQSWPRAPRCSAWEGLAGPPSSPGLARCWSLTVCAGAPFLVPFISAERGFRGMPGLWPAAFMLTALVTETVFNEPPRPQKGTESLCVQQAPPAEENQGCSAWRSCGLSRRLF